MKLQASNRRLTDGLKAGGRLSFSGIINILIAVIIFSLIVIFHELGHFLLAKRNGIAVTEFSLGMGPRLISTEKGGTRYSLKLFPIGGSCLMVGEDDDDDSAGSFNNASVWARISVVAAGPVFNFIMAFVCAMIITSVVGYDPARVTVVQEGSAAEAAGLKEGDLITEFNGKHISIGRDLSLYQTLHGYQDKTIDMKVKREGKTEDISFTADSIEKKMLGFTYSSEGPAQIMEIYIDSPMMKAGLQAGDEITLTVERNGKEREVTAKPQMRTVVSSGFDYNLYREKTGFLGVLKYSAVEVRYWITSTVQSLGLLIKGTFSVNDLSGPVGIVDAIGDSVQEAKSEGSVILSMQMLYWVILLSANLGVMNLLPIPALDGGRLVFLIIEAIRGKEVNRNVEGMIHFAGFVLLMLLMVFVLFNDIKRL